MIDSSGCLSSVLPFSEVEPELVDAVLELVAEAVAVRDVPLLADDLESYVLIGRPGVESQNRKVLVVSARSLK